MRFSCERCGKRYATNDVPVPGRIYRLKCKACGNLILVKGEAESTAPDSPSAPSEHTDPAPASLEWSAAATPLADLVRPSPAPGPGEPPEGSAEPGPPPPASSPPPLTPAPTPAPAPSGTRYVELFDERDLAEVTPTPTTGSRVLGQGPPPLGAPPPLAAPADAALPPEGSPADDPFASVRAELEAAAAEERMAPASLPSPERAEEPKGAPERPEFSPPARRGPVLAFAVAGAAVVLVLVALAVWRPFSSGPVQPPASAAPSVPAVLPPPAPAETKPAPAPAPPKAAPEPPAPAAEPAKPPPESTAAPAPPPAEAPSAKPSPPPPPPRAPPPRKAEKQVRPAAKPPERTAATRREPVSSPAEPSPAAALPAASPEPEARERESQLPTGLSPEEVQRVVGTGRRAFDVCLREPSRGLDQPIGARQVTLRFTVEPEGRVSYPTIDDVTISGAPLGQCLKNAARGLSFPAFSGDPVKVDVPIAIPGK
ncbi:MAG TPA: hypothetical protein VFG53_20895 [Anaeromyxobacter sp.]|nr:hypothetical protein [Anaeromyxobacter sp.]